MNTPHAFLQFIVTSLVDHPDDIHIEEKHDEMGTLLSLRVAPSDMGSIIGRGGKTIDSLRTVLRMYGSKKGERITLRLQEDGENPQQ